jgi:glycosyltransferase involved in cell wall biosynthesis
MKMHLVFVGEISLPGVPAGGIGTFLSVLCPALARRGHRVTVISRFPGKKGEQLHEGYQILWLPEIPLPSPFRGIWHYRHLNTFLRRLNARHRIDIIETQEIGMAYLRKTPSARLVIRLHGGHYFFCHTTGQPQVRRKALIERQSFAKCEAIIGVSQFVFNITGLYHSFGNKPAAVIPYPIDTQAFSPTISNEQGPPILFFAGSLVRKKGVFELLKAMKLVQEIFPQASLLLYGRDTRNEQGLSCRSLLENEARELSLKNIRFMGAIDHRSLPEHMAVATICIFPSHSETQGIVVLEAMSMGKPTIFGDVGPARETIEHGKDGLLCDPQNPESIASQILTLLNNPEHAAHIGAAARQTILARYSVDRVAERNVEFYKSLISLPKKEA